MTNKLKLNDSAFAMWRGIAALAYVDHKLAEQEIAFFKTRLARIELTSEQQETLDNDLANGVKLSDVYDDITEAGHRTHLLNLGYVIFHRDGNYSDVEKSFYNDIYKKHIKSIDAPKIMAEAEANAKKNLEKWAKEKDYVEDVPGLTDDIKQFFSWLF